MKKKIKNILILTLVSLLSLAIGARAATTIASTSVTYGDTTVKAALDELMGIASNIPEPVTCTPGHYCATSTSCPSGALCSKVKIGDYVLMTPTSTSYTILAGSTGYTSDRTINPSELNLWRVIDIRSDGTIDMVSEYVSSTKVYFKGQQGYLNFVGTLNLIAKQYENNNYTIGSRYIGYHGQTQVITDTSKFTNPPSLTANTSDNSNETVGGGDVMYTYDTDTSSGLVYKALGTLKAYNPSGTATAYWLGSRIYNYSSSTNQKWIGRFVNTSGSVSGYYLYRYYNGWGDGSSEYALRPIITLKSDVQATGSGTSTSPWVLS